jgi:hypothetical protein
VPEVKGEIKEFKCGGEEDMFEPSSSREENGFE